MIAIPSAWWRHVGVVVATVLALSGCVTGCGSKTDATRTYGAASARVGEALAVLVLPDASLDAVRMAASLCAQGEIDNALLCATVSVVGTHAAPWTTRG